jgi:hypothetical protein
MHSLRELNDFLVSKEIEVKEFGGWYLKVGRDTWTMTHDVFYRNGNPQSLREKNLFDNYKKAKQNERNQSNQTRKWRGISSRNYKSE